MSLLRRRKPLVLKSARNMADGTCSAQAVSSTGHTSLKKELADLKLLVKQKKKEVKAAKKEEKKKMKAESKERKKKMKGSKDCESSDSSSSSESSDDGCDSTSMRMLRSRQSILGVTGEVGTSLVPLQGFAMLASNGDRQDSGSVSSCSISGAEVNHVRTDGMGQNVTSHELLDEQKEGSGKVMLKGGLESIKSSVPSFTSPLRADQSPNRIEVCLGGKCRKAGSDLLLQELRSQVTNGCNVEAVPCKCMGKCSMAMNMKVYREDANPQHHSHVRVDDAKFILDYHFGFAPSQTSRPSVPVIGGMEVAVNEHVFAD
ncbi:hypothetical protein KP509_24G049900 [Ceratopteris richardii]|nr:hypothetical protein KP509_24G049900 [Ceratopteris richardii]